MSDPLNSDKLEKIDDNALMKSIENEDYNITEMLLEFGCNVNYVQDENGKTSLFGACLRNNIGPVNLLLENGADPNIEDINGEVSLLMAVKCNNLEMVKILLGFRANPDHMDKDCNTSLYYAESRSMAEIFSLLREFGARKYKYPFG